MIECNPSKFFETDRDITTSARCGWLESQLGVTPLWAFAELHTSVTADGLEDREFGWRICYPPRHVLQCPVWAAFTSWRHENGYLDEWPTPGGAARAFKESHDRWRALGCPGLELSAKPLAEVE